MNPNIKTVYHGSDHIVSKPTYGLGRKKNDYGRGFYTTEDVDKAEMWAYLMTKDNSRTAFNNIYELDMTDLKVINLKEYGALSWIAEVIYNRGSGDNGMNINEVGKLFCNQYRINTENADIIIGYRADDSYFRIIEFFLTGRITAEEVHKYFYTGHLGEQIFLKSEKHLKE